MSRRRQPPKKDPAAEAVAGGWLLVRQHPLFAPLVRWRQPDRTDEGVVPPAGWAIVHGDGGLHVHPTRRAAAEEWAWVYAHLLLHLGFGHHLPPDGPDDAAHRAAAEVVVWRFQSTLGFGSCPFDPPEQLPAGDEATLAAGWRVDGVPAEFAALGVAGTQTCVSRPLTPPRPRADDFRVLFAIGLTAAVSAAVDVAAGARPALTVPGAEEKPWQRARAWFIDSYPLLAAVVSRLTVVADAELAHGWGVHIAAVCAPVGELYVNPLARLDGEEWRFVIAHEALHAALAHHARIGGRDHELFNIACDFVINGWLVEMGVGTMPPGSLYDPQFAGQSAEAVYDRIATEARRYRKLATLRGPRGGDVLIDGLPRLVAPCDAVGLDDLLRRHLMNGLDLHRDGERGLLPAALVEEIRALAHPPIGWDVALARWFDEYFPALEPVRTYARPSRRAAATPDIPRPGYHFPAEPRPRRTFGVVLDTSLSMDAPLLGKALGAIASYAASHDVPAARVVYCDAAAYDAGYLSPDDIAGRVRVHGRGGTVLQPGLDLLHRAADFPDSGPILIITDGACDTLRVRNDHAYLLPAGVGLPFTPRGPVFRVQ
jgi:predicted metal-dependent peptidase